MKTDTTAQNAKIWLKKQTRPYRAFIILLAFLTMLSTGLALIFAYMVRYLINSATDGNAKLLSVFSIILLSVLLLKIIIKTYTNYFSEMIRAKMTAKMREGIFSKILCSDYAYIQKYHSGELLTRLTNDIQDVSGYSVGILPAVCGMIVQCLGAIAALLTIDPLFTGVYVVCGCLFGGITALFRKKIKQFHKEVLRADGDTRSFMQEVMSSTLTLKAYGAEHIVTDKAKGLIDTYYKKRMKRNVLNACMSFIFSILTNSGLILAVVWCSVSVLNGNTDYGSILSVILLLMQLQQPFSSFSSILPAYYARLANGERLSEIDNIACENISISNNSQDLYKKLESIQVSDVDFSYDRDSIFNNASAIIKKGDIVCLTGASGTGKSTLFKLLLNVFLPAKGKLNLIGKYENGSLPLTAKERGLFAYVPQGNFLFSGTIYENLTFFSDKRGGQVRDEDIKLALKTACAEFVWDLPLGLQTVLLEDGEGLSEGQLQRLAVARAILSNRPILLLDEATSALDSDTEKALLENIRNLKDKTCLIVTHRPAALDIADCILTVENHKIVVSKTV